jgi:hypothetical protein
MDKDLLRVFDFKKREFDRALGEKGVHGLKAFIASAKRNHYYRQPGELPGGRRYVAELNKLIAAAQKEIGQREQDGAAHEAAVAKAKAEEKEKREGASRAAEARLSAVYQKHKEERGQYAKMKSLIISPEKYESKVVRVKAHARSATYGQFHPLGTVDFMTLFYLDIPRELKDKASRVDQAVGDFGIVTITFLCTKPKDMPQAFKNYGVVLDITN